MIFSQDTIRHGCFGMSVLTAEDIVNAYKLHLYFHLCEPLHFTVKMYLLASVISLCMCESVKSVVIFVGGSVYICKQTGGTDLGAF